LRVGVGLNPTVFKKSEKNKTFKCSLYAYASNKRTMIIKSGKQSEISSAREEVAIYPNQKIYAGPTYPKLECGGPGLPRRLLVPLPKLITRGLPFPTIKKRPKV